MDHKQARTRLKEYALGEIADKEQEKEMTLHIEKCEICKRELLLWQELIDKQMVNERLASYIPKEFRDRVSYRMNKINSDRDLPPIVRRIHAMQRAMSSVTGKLIVQVLILLAALIYLIMVKRHGLNFIAFVFMAIGFIVIFIVLLRKKK
jgi:anti-sigma factor RsiW